MTDEDKPRQNWCTQHPNTIQAARLTQE